MIFLQVQAYVKMYTPCLNTWKIQMYQRTFYYFISCLFMYINCPLYASVCLVITFY
jgi:hypothetical protein